ncbi:ABC transporter ATP-binding protein [Cryptosporangium aurantiacum]|uniref:ABC-2 type transport system ATP-binding protein n=1 Tax=Cryptosporangium aurantiacum TaxID=134849 RepID=A0A1M7TVG9_9ACTN|nr:ATP-binding cassette domain-containing protein [Cryptosporangium aurantiacum]SHN74716.1 ABC-2 type transport system ATP-binding protein [Cryptosporangium aurantiacum]
MADSTLEFDGTTKRYGDLVALDDLSFDVRPGELFGFVGSNGAGKTTAMRIALGVLSADGGEVRWKGAPITLEAARRIGYMPEERGLYPKMTVADQLEYLGRLHGMSRADARAATAEWTERLGLAERRKSEIGALSLGNQQRVQLAAALLHGPELLVLDEPFSGLDPVAVDVMSGVLAERAAEGVPVLFSSHQLDLVQRLCDRVGIIRSGRLVACDSVDALRSTERQLTVDVGAPWEPALPGVRIVRTDGTRHVLELDDDVDDQDVLRSALAAGPVAEFRPYRPTLTELYRTVVTDGETTR